MSVNVSCEHFYQPVNLLCWSLREISDSHGLVDTEQAGGGENNCRNGEMELAGTNPGGGLADGLGGW